MGLVAGKPVSKGLRTTKNKGADQPAHPCNLINAFVIRYMKNIVVKLASCKVQYSSESL